MSETLLEKLGRIEKELSELKAAKPAKQIDYSKSISSTIESNKSLANQLAALTKRLEAEEKRTLILEGAKPVIQPDHTDTLTLIESKNKSLTIGMIEIQKDLKEAREKILFIENTKPLKQVDYSEGISILEDINKELNKKLSDLNAKYYELNKELLVIKNKKPIDQVDYSADILALQKQLNVLSHKASKPIDLPFVKVSSFDLMVKNEAAEKNKLIERLQFLENKKEIKHHDFKPEIQKLDLSIEKVKKMMVDSKIDIKKEIETHVNESYITNLYRNK